MKKCDICKILNEDDDLLQCAYCGREVCQDCDNNKNAPMCGAPLRRTHVWVKCPNCNAVAGYLDGDMDTIECFKCHKTSIV